MSSRGESGDRSPHTNTSTQEQQRQGQHQQQEAMVLFHPPSPASMPTPLQEQQQQREEASFLGISLQCLTSLHRAHQLSSSLAKLESKEQDAELNQWQRDVKGAVQEIENLLGGAHAGILKMLELWISQNVGKKQVSEAQLLPQNLNTPGKCSYESQGQLRIAGQGTELVLPQNLSATVQPDNCLDLSQAPSSFALQLLQGLSKEAVETTRGQGGALSFSQPSSSGREVGQDRNSGATAEQGDPTTLGTGGASKAQLLSTPAQPVVKSPGQPRTGDAGDSNILTLSQLLLQQVQQLQQQQQTQQQAQQQHQDWPQQQQQQQQQMQQQQQSSMPVQAEDIHKQVSSQSQPATSAYPPGVPDQISQLLSFLATVSANSNTGNPNGTGNLAANPSGKAVEDGHGESNLPAPWPPVTTSRGKRTEVEAGFLSKPVLSLEAEQQAAASDKVRRPPTRAAASSAASTSAASHLSSMVSWNERLQSAAAILSYSLARSSPTPTTPVPGHTTPPPSSQPDATGRTLALATLSPAAILSALSQASPTPPRGEPSQGVKLALSLAHSGPCAEQEARRTNLSSQRQLEGLLSRNSNAQGQGRKLMEGPASDCILPVDQGTSKGGRQGDSQMDTSPGAKFLALLSRAETEARKQEEEQTGEQGVRKLEGTEAAGGRGEGQDLTFLERKRLVIEVQCEEPVLRPSHDGYHWRRYGRKIIRDAPYPRQYYKCSVQTCTAKKHMQLMRREIGTKGTPDKWIAAVSYESTHNHPAKGKDTSKASKAAPAPSDRANDEGGGVGVLISTDTPPRPGAVLIKKRPVAALVAAVQEIPQTVGAGEPLEEGEVAPDEKLEWQEVPEASRTAQTPSEGEVELEGEEEGEGEGDEDGQEAGEGASGDAEEGELGTCSATSGTPGAPESRKRQANEPLASQPAKRTKSKHSNQNNHMSCSPQKGGSTGNNSDASGEAPSGMPLSSSGFRLFGANMSTGKQIE